MSIALELDHGPAPADELLIGPVARLIAARRPEAWHIVRYRDPAGHPQLRLRLRDARRAPDLLRAACEWAGALVGDGRLLRFAIVTYEREVERYGGPEAMGLVEDIFSADSAGAVDLLLCGRGTALTDEDLAVLSLDRLLGDLGVAAAARAALPRAKPADRIAAGEEYRTRQRILRPLLGAPGWLERQPGGAPVAAALAARSERCAAPARELSALGRQGHLTCGHDAIVAALVHMHCNRLLGTDRDRERLVRDLLARTRAGLERAPVSR